MIRSEFVTKYGGIYEHSSWVAEETAALVDGDVDRELLASLMADCVDNASREKQLTLIRAHPDLAGKAGVAGDLTPESAVEQASAGLDQCTREEYERFQSLNDEYREKFGFPFVMAVRDRSRAEILDAFENRLKNGYDAEFEAALSEIHKIAYMRLTALEQE